MLVGKSSFDPSLAVKEPVPLLCSLGQRPPQQHRQFHALAQFAVSTRARKKLNIYSRLDTDQRELQRPSSSPPSRVIPSSPDWRLEPAASCLSDNNNTSLIANNRRSDAFCSLLRWHENCQPSLDFVSRNVPAPLEAAHFAMACLAFQATKLTHPLTDSLTRQRLPADHKGASDFEGSIPDHVGRVGSRARPFPSHNTKVAISDSSYGGPKRCRSG